MYEIDYTQRFIRDKEAHIKSGRKDILIKIADLIEELRMHPKFGTGKPESLGGDRKGQWSRHITHKHRLIYEIREDIITVLLISAYGHYDDK